MNIPTPELPLQPMNTETPPTADTEPKAATQRSANRLTMTQTFALGQWIHDHKDMAIDKPDTLCATHASIDLGFTITAANFGNARQALGIHKAAPPKPPTIEERLATLETQCADLQSALGVQRVIQDEHRHQIATLEQRCTDLETRMSHNTSLQTSLREMTLEKFKLLEAQDAGLESLIKKQTELIEKLAKSINARA